MNRSTHMTDLVAQWSPVPAAPTAYRVPRPRRPLDAQRLAELFRLRRPQIEPVIAETFRAELRSRLTARGAA